MPRFYRSKRIRCSVSIWLTVLVSLITKSLLAEEQSDIEIIETRPIYSIDDRTNAPHNEVHFPYLYESSDGNWYMTHREGPHARSIKQFGLSWDDPRANLLTDDRVTTVMSPDRGQTWRLWPGLPHRDRNLRLWSTMLRDGSLISYICRFDKLDDDGTASLPILRSDDDGATWTRHNVPLVGTPLRAGGAGGFWGHIIEIHDSGSGANTRLLATYYGRNLDGDQAGRFFLNLAESTDGGFRWRHVATIAGPEVPGEEGPNEADIAHLGDGELLAIFRTGDDDESIMHQSRSSDFGRTWSEPEVFPLGEAGVSPAMMKLPDGRLLLCHGRRVNGDRAILARISSDGGRHWEPPVRIYEGSGKLYASLQELGEGRVAVTFDASPVSRGDAPASNAIMRVVLKIH